MSRPTFYTAFSNSMTDVIPNLSEEAMKISDLLQELAFNDKLYYIKDEIFSLDRLMLNFSKYGKRIDIFYFSGHSSDGCLQLTEGSLPPERMSQIVNSSLKNAGLIIFNACETFKLAQQIIANRKINGERFVLISCRGKINSFIAERFATLFFSQVGQPGTYRDAYDQAQAIITAIYRDTKFKEFDNKDAVLNAGDDFDIGYIELGSETATPKSAAREEAPPAAPPSMSGGAPPSASATKPVSTAASASESQATKSSIIDSDKLVRDALITNYVHEVISVLTSTSQPLEADKLELLKDALLAAEQVANGEKKNKKVSDLFDKAAKALPGLTSGSAFDSLINAEKNMDKAKVKNLINSNQSGTIIKELVDQVSSLKH